MPLSELPALKTLLLTPVVKFGEKAAKAGKRNAKRRR